jgi:carbamoyl-phosphate synthase small subunit
MKKRAILALQDGTIYEGYSFGADTDISGEVVFYTSMTGYQEMLTDPSYAGQIVLPTYPLIGNYGTNDLDIESCRIQVRGFVVREECSIPAITSIRKPSINTCLITVFPVFGGSIPAQSHDVCAAAG